MADLSELLSFSWYPGMILRSLKI